MYAHEPPEYFPSLAFFAQMAAVDTFVVDDGLQYSRQSLQNRARLRTPDGVQWITVPLAGGQFGRSIADTEIDHSQNWVTSHLKAFRFDYGSAPFYGHYLPAIEEILRRAPARLGELTRALVACLHAQLRLDSRLVSMSESYAADVAETQSGHRESLHEKNSRGASEHYSDNRRITEQNSKSRSESEQYSVQRPNSRIIFGSEWASDSPEIRLVRTCPVVGTRLYADAGDASRIKILNFTCPEYRQNFSGFAPDLSALDLLFNHGPDAAHILRAGTRAAIPLDGG